MAAALEACGYTGWLSVEMRRPDGDWQTALKRALAVARRAVVKETPGAEMSKA